MVERKERGCNARVQRDRKSQSHGQKRRNAGIPELVLENVFKTTADIHGANVVPTTQRHKRGHLLHRQNFQGIKYSMIPRASSISSGSQEKVVDENKLKNNRF